jgi:hypothetical protein
VCVRDRGVTVPSERRSKLTRADEDRSLGDALVVAWVMPKIVLMFRMNGTVHMLPAEQFCQHRMASSESARPNRIVPGMTLRIRTLVQAKFDAQSSLPRRFAAMTVG